MQRTAALPLAGMRREPPKVLVGEGVLPAPPLPLKPTVSLLKICYDQNKVNHMDRIIAASIVFLLLLVGFISIRRDYKRLSDQTVLATEFLKKFTEYLNSQGKDYSLYSWLIQKSPKLQIAMGQYGVMQAYSPPYSGVMYQNYQTVVNLLPEIRREFEDDIYLRNVRGLREYANLIHESLLRYIGDLDDRLNDKIKELRNPVIWLREGGSWVLLLPLLIFHWLGLLGESLLKNIANNLLFRILSGIVTLLGLLSTIITIVVGWDSFVGYLEKLGIF